MNLSDAKIHCTYPEAKSLERQYLSSTHTLAITGYIEPSWMGICQKFICLEMEMINALLHWNKSWCFFTPFCKVPQFAAFVAAEPCEGRPSARLLCESGAFSPEEEEKFIQWELTSWTRLLGMDFTLFESFPYRLSSAYLSQSSLRWLLHLMAEPCLEGLLQKNPAQPIFCYQAHIVRDIPCFLPKRSS